jgi:hypothetical protein
MSYPILFGNTSASGAQFIPTDISSLSLWLDASDTSTIIHTSNKVSQWNDKSSNGLNVVQSIDANRPLTNTVTRNGKNVLSFDGVNDILLNTSNNLFGNVNGFGLYVVVRNTATLQSRPVHKAMPGTPANRAGFAMARLSPPTFETFFRRLNTDTLSNAVSTTGINSNWNMLGQIVNSSTGVNAIRLNAVQESTAATTIGTITNESTGDFAVGGNSALTQYMAGEVAEVMAYSKILTAGEIFLIESYLKQKWSI